MCGTEVKDNENEEEIRGNKDRTKRLVEQTATIRDLLKRLDDVVLPTWVLISLRPWRLTRPPNASCLNKRFNVERWLEFNGPAGVTASAEIDGGKGLQAQLAGDDDEELMKVKRDADAAEKRFVDFMRPCSLCPPNIYDNPDLKTNSRLGLRNPLFLAS